MKIAIYFPVLALALVVCSAGCEADQSSMSLEVTATAYTSSPGETNSNTSLTAWGDKLKPGMKAIAVSQDLIEMGLSHNKRVEIDGLKGTYIVLDRMHKRWKRKIDIYMGSDVKKAKEWGKRKIKIYWKDDKS
jgi:3D (Asp-Asp-Asp) domain-containing protein